VYHFHAIYHKIHFHRNSCNFLDNTSPLCSYIIRNTKICLVHRSVTWYYQTCSSSSWPQEIKDKSHSQHNCVHNWLSFLVTSLDGDHFWSKNEADLRTKYIVLFWLDLFCISVNSCSFLTDDGLFELSMSVYY
jgi:hypothetical protein